MGLNPVVVRSWLSLEKAFFRLKKILMAQTMMACDIEDFKYLLGSENWKISAIEEDEGIARA